MKKFLAVLVAVMFLYSFTLSAAVKRKSEEKQMNLFGDVGVAFSDFEGLFIDAGFQYGLTPKLFGEVLVEYYFGPAGSEVDSSSFGFNLNGVYKHPINEQLKVFAKAGICLIHTSVDLGYYGTASDSDFGFNAGGGVEYAINEQMGIRGGLTFKVSFAEGDTGTFFKAYGGFYYNLSK